ncbi:uncharacterized protein LOC116340898 [Contarinia nasturtii]|uniref:uncharacterized protein LOC116340898 n=1 Tax=Contarinia nasturtii TaxID=265458 RepID=UPI0012D49E8B|nr:uncharacterized protein LOC116340898 [Contarinia nasturtii]
MKTFIVLLVSVALCSAASKTSEKSNKKRSLLELGASNFGNLQSAPYPAALSQSYQSLATAPVAASYQSLATPFVPSQQLVPETNSFAHLQPFQHDGAPGLVQHVGAPGLVQHVGAPGLVQHVGAPGFVQHAVAAPALHAYGHIHQEQFAVQPTVKTLVKHVHVPYERHIKVDNPIYTPVERQIPIDNPVAVVKVVKRPVPIHVEQPVPIAIVKEIRENAPYVHKVRLVLQQVFVKNQQAPKQQYIPPQEHHAELPQQHFDAPAAPSQSYVPPQTHHHDAPAAPSQSYVPPATSYGVPSQTGY